MNRIVVLHSFDLLEMNIIGPSLQIVYQGKWNSMEYEFILFGESHTKERKCNVVSKIPVIHSINKFIDSQACGDDIPFYLLIENDPRKNYELLQQYSLTSVQRQYRISESDLKSTKNGSFSSFSTKKLNPIVPDIRSCEMKEKMFSIYSVDIRDRLIEFLDPAFIDFHQWLDHHFEIAFYEPKLVTNQWFMEFCQVLKSKYRKLISNPNSFFWMNSSQQFESMMQLLKKVISFPETITLDPLLKKWMHLFENHSFLFSKKSKTAHYDSYASFIEHLIAYCDRATQASEVFPRFDSFFIQWESVWMDFYVYLLLLTILEKESKKGSNQVRIIYYAGQTHIKTLQNFIGETLGMQRIIHSESSCLFLKSA